MSFKIHYDQNKESSPRYYGWILALFGNLIIGLMTISNFQGTGFFLKAFERQKGWGRAAISGALVLSEFTKKALTKFKK